MSNLKTYIKKPEFIDAAQWDESGATLAELKRHGFPWSGHRGHRDTPDLAADLRMKVGQSTVRIEKGDWIYRQQGSSIWGLMTPEEFAKHFGKA